MHPIPPLILTTLYQIRWGTFKFIIAFNYNRGLSPSTIIYLYYCEFWTGSKCQFTFWITMFELVTNMFLFFPYLLNCCRNWSNLKKQRKILQRGYLKFPWILTIISTALVAAFYWEKRIVWTRLKNEKKNMETMEKIALNICDKPSIDHLESLSDTLYDSFSSCASQGSNDIERQSTLSHQWNISGMEELNK